MPEVVFVGSPWVMLAIGFVAGFFIGEALEMRFWLRVLEQRTDDAD